MKTLIAILLLLPSLLWASTTSVTLGWDASIDEPYLMSYKVYWGMVKGEFPKPGSATVFATEHRYTVQDLADGTYYFVVTAIDTRGLESIPSNEVEANLSTMPPRPPLSVKVIEINIKVK